MSDNKAYEKILNIIEDHRRDGFEVPAIRVDEDTWEEILCSRDLIIQADEYRINIDIDWKKYDGMIAGTKIIVDENISEPVPDDIKGTYL